MLHLKRVLASVLLGHEPSHDALIGSRGIQVESGIQVKMHTNCPQGSGGECTSHKNTYKLPQGSGIHVKTHTKHTNGPQGTRITCKDTIEIKHGTFRGAGLHVKTQ